MTAAALALDLAGRLEAAADANACAVAAVDILVRLVPAESHAVEALARVVTLMQTVATLNEFAGRPVGSPACEYPRPAVEVIPR